jgi:hypothetical protein
LLQALEMRARRRAEAPDELRRALDHLLHVGILGIEDAQRIGVQPALRVGVERFRAGFEIRDEIRAMRAALVEIADRIDLEPRAVVDAERAPQPRQHHHLLGVDIRAAEPERFDVELVELPVASLFAAARAGTSDRPSTRAAAVRR